MMLASHLVADKPTSPEVSAGGQGASFTEFAFEAVR